MRQALLKLLREERLLAPGDAVLVAVSGGADSVALLHLLHSLPPDFPLALHAAHLDHAIRPQSAADAAFVRRLCDTLGIPLVVGRIDVPALSCERRLGLEEAGREARREFLRTGARRLGCACIALAHHRDDQAETVLHRLLRGSAAPGLSGMRLRSGPFIRPLLGFTARQLRDYLAAHGLPHVEDASNRDPAFTRNRLRHEVMPHLAELNPRIGEHLARLGSRLALEETYWEEEEQRALDRLGRGGEGELRLDRDGLLALHPALRLRVLRRALAAVRGDLRRLEAAHLEAVEGLLHAAAPQGETHLPGGWAGRRYGQLWLRRAAPAAVPPPVVVIAGPGVYPLPGGGVLRVELAEAPRGEGKGEVEFDAAQVAFPLELRTFRPGDRFRPSGMAGRRKLKEYFIDAKIEREERQLLPLVADAEVLWLVGRRRCEGRRPRAAQPVLRLVAGPPAAETDCL
jgi:tRNA(Ile)-lysidine synthase